MDNTTSIVFFKNIPPYGGTTEYAKWKAMLPKPTIEKLMSQLLK